MATSVVQRASLAAQVAAQSRLSAVSPSRPVTLPPSNLPISLSELDARFRSLVTLQRKTCAEMAYVAFRLWQADEWESLGCDGPDAYCDAIGIGVNHFRNLVTLGDRLQHLTLQEMQNLTYAAMQWLAKVHPKIWDEYAWVEEAKALPSRDFAMLVAQRNEQITKTLVEPRVSLTIRVPTSHQAAIERRLETIRRQEKLGSTAEALTYALESVDRAWRMADTLSEIQAKVAELNRIQDSLRETREELEMRLESGSDHADARARAQKLMTQIVRTIGEVVEVSAEEVLCENG